MGEQPTTSESVSYEESLAKLLALGVSPLDGSFWSRETRERGWAKNMPSGENARRIIGLVARPNPGQEIDLDSIDVFIATSAKLDHADVCNALRDSGLYPDLPTDEQLRAGKPSPSDSSRLIFFAGVAQPMGDFNEAEITSGSSGMGARWELDRKTAGLSTEQAKQIAVNAAKSAAASAGIDLQAGVSL